MDPVFGRKRIRRDTEAIGFASGLGRLIRPSVLMDFEPKKNRLLNMSKRIFGSIRVRLSGMLLGLTDIYLSGMDFYGFLCSCIL